MNKKISQNTNIVDKKIEIIPNRFYFISTSKNLQFDPNLIFDINIDQALNYLPFNDDFGPLKISCVYQYVLQLNIINTDPQLKNKIFWHITRADPKKYLNSIVLVCAYMMIFWKKSPEQAYKPFENFQFPGFKDASTEKNNLTISVLDCLKGLSRAIQLKWFDFKSFSLDNYEFYEKTQNGDINQIIDQKLYAFSLPYSSSTDQFGNKLASYQQMAENLQLLKINIVVQLQECSIFTSLLQKYGVQVHKILYSDHKSPENAIVQKFNAILQQSGKKKIGVFCKTGLKKTGALISTYAIKNFKFKAKQIIAWIRMCRPGSVSGHQQQFLFNFEQKYSCKNTSQNKQQASSDLDSPLRRQRRSSLQNKKQLNQSGIKKQNSKQVSIDSPVLNNPKLLNSSLRTQKQDQNLKPKVGFNIDSFLNSLKKVNNVKINN